jgi:hypothetical protein
MSATKYTSRLGGFIDKFITPIGQHAHVTISFLDRLDEQQVKIAFAELEKIFESRTVLNFKIIGEDNFGPKKDIPVFTLQMMDKDMERLLAQFHKTFGKPDNGFYTEVPNWHVSKRNIEKDLHVGEIITARSVDIKQLGPHDPVYKISLTH